MRWMVGSCSRNASDHEIEMLDPAMGLIALPSFFVGLGKLEVDGYDGNLF